MANVLVGYISLNKPDSIIKDGWNYKTRLNKESNSAIYQGKG